MCGLKNPKTPNLSPMAADAITQGGIGGLGALWISMDVIKQSELELANADFEIYIVKNPLFSIVHKTFNCCISGTNKPLFRGFFAKCSIKNA